ncbi:MAG: citrate synthase family protein [Gammaproteobacteria bacterium]
MSKHNGPAQLAQHVDHWETRMGAFFLGERAVFRGKDLHTTFADAEWLDLYVFSILGRRLSAPQIKLLNAIWVYTSYPDPRLWNNRVVALGGTARSTAALSLSAALAVSEATIYGRRPDIKTMDFLRRARVQVEAGADLGAFLQDELRRHRTLGGYGRPVVGTDERLPHLLGRAEQLGIERGPYVQLAFEIERVLMVGRWRLRMNYAALAAAFCADMGFTPQEFYLFGFPAFLAGMLPCYLAAQEQAEGVFLPLPCDRIAYQGAPRRRWD